MAKRIIPLILLLLLVVFQVQLWSGRGSVHNVQELERRLQEQQAQNAEIRAANEQLAAEVRDLKEGLEMVEQKARQELGMVKPNEIFVQIAN